jgi:hypothetical protein
MAVVQDLPLHERNGLSIISTDRIPPTPPFHRLYLALNSWDESAQPCLRLARPRGRAVTVAAPRRYLLWYQLWFRPQLSLAFYLEPF